MRIVQRGICSLKHNAFASALNDFSFAYVFCPKDLQVLCNLAVCHFNLGNWYQAEEFANKGLYQSQISPGVVKEEEFLALLDKIREVRHKFEKTINPVFIAP